MNQVNYTPTDLFPGSGFVQSTVPEQFREEILKEIEETKDSEEHDYTGGLVGAIKREFALPKLTDNDEFRTFLKLLVNAYNEHFNDVIERYKDIQGELIPRKGFWVNHQSKGEYNPVHHHSGMYSFVIWIKIPYDLQEEKNLFPNNPSPRGIGSFSFIYHCDDIQTYAIDVDQSYEWEIIMFPSWRSHTVAPFLTSDDTRISIAGNLTKADPSGIIG